MLVRLQKIIADRGYCSRRKAEELISGGKVYADGVLVSSLGSKFDEDKVRITIGEDTLPPRPAAAGYHYFLVNKPVGFITTLSDDRGRKTVDILLPAGLGRLFPVGRLDINSSGALIMTDDGEFANLVAHPSSGLDKTYLVVVNGIFTPSERQRIERGIELEDGLTAPAQVKTVSVGQDESAFEIVLREGRNREIRRMVEALGHQTLSLTRIRIGPLRLSGLPRGAYKEIPLSTVEEIKKQCLYNKAHNTYLKS